MFDGERAAST